MIDSAPTRLNARAMLVPMIIMISDTTIGHDDHRVDRGLRVRRTLVGHAVDVADDHRQREARERRDQHLGDVDRLHGVGRREEALNLIPT